MSSRQSKGPTPVRPVAVLDIDGVLADVRHRLHFLATRPKNWDGFFAAATDDPPLDDGIRLAMQLADGHDLVYLTGRPARCRADTLAWLARYELPEGRLVMRRSGDRRPARITKAELLRDLARTRSVAVVVDDDPDVVASLKAGGWPVRHADWMDRAPALHIAQEVDGRT